ncbi:hypothetical protein [Raoultella ornithinolytica]|uniref:hypothetical protein n=1 Tax=Raoultella ornithinolytica TaxID=54291 RepID=UPI000CF358A8|nr:hypothetical protein [Raoultella ornithinolytica]PQH15956.1 hypothetical protein C5T92_03490 [Raoultella ornithinolytica]PQH39288.1 hypothetical protein C5T94_02075 [Raoultella ornithinolytica]WLP48227.1 hypothetical protein Q7A27_10965 [Raoultella ornithinolytica]HEC2554009.1 hypothetical protein [Raoultella ornithinolytica]HEC2606876.1 hypothetical protein [Raoultella ornithinolytica]
MSEKTKRELELEIELRETRRQLFIANASVMELRSVINDHEISALSRELKLLFDDNSEQVEKTRDEYATETKED